MKAKIKLVLVDDHSLFREGLGRLLSAEEDLELVGNCSSIEDALAVLDKNKVDLILLDFDLGEQQGTSFLDRAKKQGYEGRVLMVTAGMSDADILRALDHGTAGIFLKHSPPVELLEAIRKVVQGERWLDPSSARVLNTSAISSQGRAQNSPTLNARERAVLKGVFEGLTNKEIGVRLNISEGYVKAVMQQLFDKTGVRSRSQLVRIALEKYAQYGLDSDS
jgi:two-component system, NarL family, nitrate/nitrite response regulator NarL